jgi:AcrR family transcriptional regulator
MRPQKIDDDDLLAALTKVFRSKGYEGTSLKELSDVTGLKKASLYHRFPDGKQEMALSVLNYMDAWVVNNVFKVLNNETDPPTKNLENGLEQINKLYEEGMESCILRALSMQSGLDLFQQNIANGISAWLEAFKNLGITMGFSESLAEEKAMHSLVDIQGSLVVSKALQDTNFFKETLKRVKKRYS